MKWWPVGLAGFPVTRWWLAISAVSQAGDGKALLAGCSLTPQGLETTRRYDQLYGEESRKSSRHSAAPVTSNKHFLLLALWSLGRTPAWLASGRREVLDCAKIVLCPSCQVPL